VSKARDCSRLADVLGSPDTVDKLHQAIAKLSPGFRDSSLTVFNDYAGWAEVNAVLDEAGV
jgi:hypothetical protein